MSRFADPTLIKVVPLGPCACPGTPHAQDEATVHRQLGYGVRVDLRLAANRPGGVFSSDMATLTLLEAGVVSWNLLDPNGKAMPVTAEAIRALDPATVALLDEALDGAIERPDLPKASAGGSPAGTPAKQSRTPRRTSETSSTSTSS